MPCQALPTEFRRPDEFCHGCEHLIKLIHGGYTCGKSWREQLRPDSDLGRSALKPAWCPKALPPREKCKGCPHLTMRHYYFPGDSGTMYRCGLSANRLVGDSYDWKPEWCPLKT